jgi:outer membrane protein TolC
MVHRIRIAAALAAAVLGAPAAAQQLSLSEAQALASAAAPQLLAQSASVRAARASSSSARELPDPKLIAALENVPADGEDRFSLTRDPMTMRKIGLMQDFPREEKRRLRGERAEAEARREEALLVVSEANLQRDVALAWIEAWSAEQQLALAQELAREAELGVSAAEGALAGGRGPAADSIAARLSAAQAADRLTEARRMATRTREQLARWVGRHGERPLDAPPDFTRIAHAHEDLLGDLENHPHLAMYGPMQDMAEAEMKLAEAAKRPDWSLEVTYAVRGSAYANMLNVGVRIDLPIFEATRQAPGIASRVAALEQVRSQAEDARRAHLAEVRVTMADWQAAQERSKRIESLQVPLARERLQAAMASYAGGRGDLTPVLEARRVDVETRSALLQARTEMGRAWAQLDSLLPHGAAKEKP